MATGNLRRGDTLGPILRRRKSVPVDLPRAIFEAILCDYANSVAAARNRYGRAALVRGRREPDSTT
jgi:hypothetical protein